MKTHETTTPVRAFDRAYINGQFVTPHGTQVVDLVNPSDNKVIGKVTMADEIDTRKAIGAAKEAFNTFSQSSKEYRMELLQRLHDAVAKRMDQLVEATVVEYGAPLDRAKGSNNLAANIFLHFKKVLEDFDLVKTVGTSKVVMEPAGVVGIFTPWNSSAGSIARRGRNWRTSTSTARSWMSRKWHFCSATRIRIHSIELSERGRGRHPPS